MDGREALGRRCAFVGWTRWRRRAVDCDAGLSPPLPALEDFLPSGPEMPLHLPLLLLPVLLTLLMLLLLPAAAAARRHRGPTPPRPALRFLPGAPSRAEARRGGTTTSWLSARDLSPRSRSEGFDPGGREKGPRQCASGLNARVRGDLDSDASAPHEPSAGPGPLRQEQGRLPGARHAGMRCWRKAGGTERSQTLQWQEPVPIPAIRS